jgi:exodeoxyribonuclease V beta subunit
MTSPILSAPHDLDVFTCPLDGIRLIEASAGTGKTWNICGLYLRLLLERELPVEAILVVTFTRAATAELKSRIRERIVETLGYLAGVATSKDPFVAQLIDTLEGRGLTRDTITARLDNALQVFDEAAIFTIHGYCQRALAETPFAAALPFALELADNDLELRLEVTRDFWRRHIAAEGCSAELGELLIEKKDSPERWAELLGKYLARPLAEKRWPDAEAGTARSSDALRAELAAAFDAARVAWGGDGAAPKQALLDGMAALNARSYNADSVAVSVKLTVGTFTTVFGPASRSANAWAKLFNSAPPAGENVRSHPSAVMPGA